MPIIQKMILLKSAGWTNAKIMRRLDLDPAWAEPIFKSQMFSIMVEMKQKEMKE